MLLRSLLHISASQRLRQHSNRHYRQVLNIVSLSLLIPRTKHFHFLYRRISGERHRVLFDLSIMGALESRNFSGTLGEGGEWSHLHEHRRESSALALHQLEIELLQANTKLTEEGKSTEIDERMFHSVPLPLEIKDLYKVNLWLIESMREFVCVS